MDDREKQIPPPRSWEIFEDLCHQLFKAVWCDPMAQKVGRLGQAQQGVDIYGSPNGNYGIFQGVQCKAKDSQYGSNPSFEELQKEIAKAEGFEPTLQHWIFATTAPVDATLQQKAREISAMRDKEGRFTVSVLGWGEITNLLCQHKQVLSEFYPGHGFDVSQLLNDIQAMPHASEVRELLDIVRRMGTVQHPTHPHSSWRPVVFGDGRDLGPALMGRSLGPEDAAACPRLLEADAAVNELKQAYSARIVGEPGSGKSICAYQTALHFANNGWSVLRLTDPRVDTIELEVPDAWPRAIFIIDDAHLTSKSALRVAEDAAGPQRLLLSTHNAVKHDTSSRGAIIIDTKRAVRTVASTLRNEPERTLDVVRRIDNNVGHLSSNVSLEDRIVQAEQQAQFPWQFCFILGGGWRRAERAAAAARSAHADITLAGIAIRRLASRDARPSLDEVTALLDVAGLSTAEVQASVQWLTHARLIIGPHDLRCPHQRFALVVFRKVLEGQDNVGRERIGRLLQHIVADVDYPIAGLRLLLKELSFTSGTQSWTFLIPEASLGSLIERCWQASKPEDRTFASLLLSEIGFYVEGWPRTQLEGRQHILGRWISDPVEPSGYGLAWLIHAVYNKDEIFARALVEASDPRALAAAISAVTSKTAYNLGEILSALPADPGTPWGRTFLENLDRPKLIGFAANWPKSEPAWAFTNFCHAIPDETLALDMVERFIPTAQKLLYEDPISAFRDLDDIVSNVLRILDVLGVYVGQYAPKSRHRMLARKMLQTVKPSRLGEQLSASPLRQFQSTGFLLHFMAQVVPAKFRATAVAMDWMRIAETIGDQWRNLPHEAEFLFGVASQTCREKIEQVIHDNLHRIEAFPPSLVLIAPNAAYRHAEQGRLIRLAHYGHVDWQSGVEAIAYFAEEHPNLLEAILKPSEITTGRVFSKVSPSCYDEAADYIRLLKEVAPLSLQRILNAVDVRGAERGWTASLRYRKGPRRTVALLIESSLERPDELGALARRLRLRFPKSSVPVHS